MLFNMCLKIKKPYMRKIQIHVLYSESTFTQSSSGASVHTWTCLRSQHFQKYTNHCHVYWYCTAEGSCLSLGLYFIRKKKINTTSIFFFSPRVRIGGELDDIINKKCSFQCSHNPILNMSKLLVLTVTKHTFVHF